MEKGFENSALIFFSKKLKILAITVTQKSNDENNECPSLLTLHDGPTA